MAALVDTSVLVRLANVTDARHPIATRAVAELRNRGVVLYLTPQALIEFRAVATRPARVNGIGMTPAEVDGHAAAFEASFPLLADTPDIYPAWRAVVTRLGVVGKLVHDARLAAVCHAHGVADVLTFNLAGFTRLAAAPPGLGVIDPAQV